MALSSPTIHVAFHTIRRADHDKELVAPVYGPLIASQTFTGAGTATVPPFKPLAGNLDWPMARIVANVDTWLTFGTSPQDPSQSSSTRDLLQASEAVYEIMLQDGETVAVAPA